jgi:hypothetical protein
MRPVSDARIARRIARTLRGIPIDAIAPDIVAHESDRSGLWCVVAGTVEWVPENRVKVTTLWSDDLYYAQYARWLAAHPERVHKTHEAAVAFVRAKLTSDCIPRSRAESADPLSDEASD